MNKLFKVMLSSFLAFTCAFNTVHAEEATELTVEKIVAYSKVADGQREVHTFEITVNDETLIEGITAEDFEITNNSTSIPMYIDGSRVPAHETDITKLTVTDKVITMEVTPFDYEGMYNASFSRRNAWAVTCEKFPALSFKKANVTEVKTQTIDDFEFGTFTAAGITREYALYVPKDAEGPVPLVIWNHGGGEYRMNIHDSMVANRGATGWIEAGLENTAVLYVQISNANYSYRPNDTKKQLIDQNNALQAALVKKLIADGTVDENRVYVTGASSGGGATMRFIMQYPELFAAAVPMCSMDPIVNIHQGASGDYNSIVKQLETAFQGTVWTWDEETQAMVKKDIDTQALVDLPIYFVHCQPDTTCRPESSKAYHEALQNLGSTNDKIKIYSEQEMNDFGLASGLAHWGSWVITLNDASETGTMAWMFNQVKPHLEVESIVANSQVGDGQKEITSFEITVNDPKFIEGLTAEDFDIINNGPSNPVDPETNAVNPAYTDDGITLTIDGNKITMEVTPFDNEGVYNAWFQRQAWKVVNENYPALSFTKADVESYTTKTLDDFIRGEFTYADVTAQYALYVPENAEGPVPLVIWNHGGGEYGIDIEKTLVANRGVTSWIEAGYETAVLMVQIPNGNYSYFENSGNRWQTAEQQIANFTNNKIPQIDRNNALQAALVRELIAEGTVDENRVYVTGASSGGGATMRFIMQFPEMFAAAIPMCSMDPIYPIHHNTTDDYDTIVAKLEEAFQGTVWTWDEETETLVEKEINTQALVDLPIYFTHAEEDTTCYPTSSKAYKEALENLGSTNDNIVIWSHDEMAEYGVAKMVAHWSWVRVFNDTAEDAPMAWMFNQINVTNLVAELEEAVADLEENYTLESVEDAKAIIEAAEAVGKLEATEAQIERLDAVVEEAEAIIDSIEKVEGIIADVEAIPETFSPDDKEVNATIEAIVESIEALNELEAGLVDEDTIATLEAAIEQLTNYEFTEGANGKWGKGDKVSLSFTVNALFSKFRAVYVDDEIVNSKNYTVKEGSTIVNLKPAYLETLSVGEHKLTVEFEDKEVTTTFIIAAEPVHTQTGDNANITLWVSLLGLSLIAVAYANKKRQLNIK